MTATPSGPTAVPVPLPAPVPGSINVTSSTGSLTVTTSTGTMAPSLVPPMPIAACQVVPSSRSDCGFPGITQQSCILRGCCYDSSIPNVIWCFNATNAGIGSAGSNQTPFA